MTLQQAFPEQSEADRAAALMACSEILFRRAAENVDPIPNTAAALRLLLEIAKGPLVFSDEQIGATLTAIEAAAPNVSAAARPKMSPDRVFFAMGVAAGFVRIFAMTPEEAQRHEPMAAVLDRVDHVGLLASELEAVLLRQRIADRGDVLWRAGTLRQIFNGDSPSSSIH